MMKRSLTIGQIQAATASFYRISLRDMLSTSRERRFARPRQVAMYLSTRLTHKSLHQLGTAFRRDHSSVHYGQHQIGQLIASGDPIQLEVVELIEQLTKLQDQSNGIDLDRGDERAIDRHVGEPKAVGLSDRGSHGTQPQPDHRPGPSLEVIGASVAAEETGGRIEAEAAEEIHFGPPRS
jgi:hypothetical protein